MTDNFRILIVDDQKTNRDVLKYQILSLEHTPILAENGLSALAQINKHPPDLILLDITMPEMDGFQVLEKVKSDKILSHIPVIMISALDEMTNIVRCIELGAVDYLVKPFNPTLLKARIDSALGAKRMRDQEDNYRKQIEEYNLKLEDRVRERTQEVESTRLEIIQRLGRAAEYRDNETGMHVIRMSHFSATIGRAAGLTKEECEMLLNASPLHDLGKIGVPDHILLKPGKLDDDEWKIMKTHPGIGGKILSKSNSDLLKMAETIALVHQEKWDGSGYPKGLKGEEIPFFGRIVAIADVFDALTTERPYKKAWPVEKAVALIEEESGKHFDPQLVPIFKNILPEILEIKEKFAEK
ncbi:MAG: response regulator [Nitrospinae bacterium]|nr:response regulator [Nitrospinota bacterium]